MNAQEYGKALFLLADEESIAERKKDQEILDLFHKVPEGKRELVLSMIRVAIENL